MLSREKRGCRLKGDCSTLVEPLSFFDECGPTSSDNPHSCLPSGVTQASAAFSTVPVKYR
jgi:hypothetical protein